MSGPGPAAIDVAPREISDYVYRASRLTGADHGPASDIAQAAVFAHVQLRSGLANVLGSLERGRMPAWGRPFVAAAEGVFDSAAEMPSDIVVADLAVFAWEAGTRGRLVHLEAGDGRVLEPHEWLRPGRADLPVSGLRAVEPAGDALSTTVLGRVAERAGAAAAAGVSIDHAVWQRLLEAARSYLVPEAELDRLT